jgi:hypothetical protein
MLQKEKEKIKPALQLRLFGTMSRALDFRGSTEKVIYLHFF